MFRTVVALVALTACGTGASAQPPRPGQLPLAPGVHPASPIGPGTHLLPPTPRFVPPAHGMSGGTRQPHAPTFGRGAFASMYHYPYPSYGYGYGDWGYGVPYGGTYGGAQPVFDAYPPLPVRPTEPGIVLANEFPAALTIQFPAAAAVWLDGKPLDGDAADAWVLKSAVLKPGEEHTFRVTARWAKGGKVYEATRAVTLGPGARSRLLVVSGDEVGN